VTVIKAGKRRHVYFLSFYLAQKRKSDTLSEVILKLRFHGRANPSCSSGEQKICLAPLASELHVTSKSGKRQAARWICSTVETRLYFRINGKLVQVVIFVSNPAARGRFVIYPAGCIRLLQMSPAIRAKNCMGPG
jgi:hypothetical protein